MKILFTHAGVERTLNKHPKIQQKIRCGEMTEAYAKDYPWYLRVTINGLEETFKLTALKKDDAITEAKDLLRGQKENPSEFAEFLAARHAKKGVTIGTLCTEWFAAGLPFSTTKLRTVAAAAELKPNADRALNWWKDIAVATITHRTHAEFAVWRRTHTKKQSHTGQSSGARSTNKELAALSCLCQWAVKADRITANPFESRESFQEASDVRHCHDAMPDNDEQFHRVLSTFFDAPPEGHKLRSTPEERGVVGAWLAFSALSGLRPGEHTYLQRVPEVKAFPSDLRAAPCGLLYPMPDGSKRMKVFRTKHGQNPAVLIYPALQDFLDHYLPWRDQHFPDSTALFPALASEYALGGYLKRACAALKMKHLKPHGFGRAYYVRVRRSQGIDDAAISAELGQKSDGSLIRSVYGDPLDPVGGNLHNWLPEHGHNAWSVITGTTVTNIIKVGRL